MFSPLEFDCWPPRAKNQGFTVVKPIFFLLLCVAFPSLVDRSPPSPGPARTGPVQRDPARPGLIRPGMVQTAGFPVGLTCSASGSGNIIIALGHVGLRNRIRGPPTNQFVFFVLLNLFCIPNNSRHLFSAASHKHFLMLLISYEADLWGRP